MDRVIEVLTVAATSSAPELALRPWQNEDLAALAEIPPDPALERWSTFPVGRTAEIREWIAEQSRGRLAGERISFAVLTGDRPGPVAHVVLKPKRAAASAEVGYWTAPAARGRGVASRAVRAVCDWAFAAYRLRCLELIHQVDNEASCAVAAKTGFSLAAILPAEPPWPLDGHLHIRHREGSAGRR